MYNNELYHYGVPGMRWGHRKAMGIASTKKEKRIPFPFNPKRPDRIPYDMASGPFTPKAPKEPTAKNAAQTKSKGKKIVKGLLVTAGVGAVTVGAAKLAVSYGKLLYIAKGVQEIINDFKD